MSSVMAERTRVVFDTDEELRLAIRLAAAREGVKLSEMINRILRKALASELQDAKKYTPRRGKE